MIPTPDLTHLTRQHYEHIYEPSEDTFLLLDALEADAQSLRDRQPRVCLEIGSGSGCVITMLAGILGQSNAVYFTTDINPRACRATKQTAEKNRAHLVEPVETTLIRGLFPRLKQNVDVLCFNPPYVVTPHEEVSGSGIEASWAGGVDGREVIDEMLPLVEDLLSEKGVFYLLLIKENRPTEVAEIMQSKYGMQVETVMQRRAGREHQFILKIQRAKIL